MFVVVTLSVRNQVRQTVASNLESTQRLFAAVETRRQHELRGQAETLADNATLKAALDTYQSETQANRATVRADLLETIDLVLEKVAARVESDAVVLVDSHQVALARGRTDGGPLAAKPAGVARRRAAPGGVDSFDGVARVGDNVFRVVTVPLLLDDATIGTLYVATSLDQDYAQELDRLAGTRIAIVSDGLVAGHHARAARRAAIRVGGRRRPARGRHDRARRRIVRVPAARRGRRHGVLRARVDRRIVAGGDARRDAQPRAHRRPRDRARRRRQLLARAPAERADRRAVDVAGRDGGVARRLTRGCR